MPLLAGDTDGYRRACARTVERFGQTGDPRTAYVVARVCGLGPGAVADPTTPVRLAKKAVAADARVAAYLQALALTEYRAGQLDEAVGDAQKSMEVETQWPGQVNNWLVLALAHHRLGHAAEARKWLDKADRWIAEQRKPLPPGDVGSFGGLHVHDWLACEVLRREAQVIRPAEAPSAGARAPR